MDLHTEILKEHSKVQTEKIAMAVIADNGLFNVLLHIFFKGENREVQRAAWVLSTIADVRPKMLTPHLSPIVLRMTDAGLHVAVKRNVVRLLQFVDIPEALHGEVMNVCFDMLADPKEAVAVRCCAMTVLDNLSKHYPDIRQELVAIVKDQLEHEPTAAFRSRAKRVLKK